jgi:hypothetical protein
MVKYFLYIALVYICTSLHRAGSRWSDNCTGSNLLKNQQVQQPAKPGQCDRLIYDPADLGEPGQDPVFFFKCNFFFILLFLYIFLVGY